MNHCVGESFKQVLRVFKWLLNRSILGFFRDDAILPSSGFLLSISQELAGLGGDVLFFKNILVTAFFFVYR